MLDYCLLNELDCESPVSGGLSETIYVIPAWAVVSTPAFNVSPSSDPVELVAGATSTPYKFPVGVLKFREESRLDSRGDYTVILLEGYRNRLSPEHMEEIRKLQPGHYVVIYVDTEKQQRVLGTKDKPLFFEWVADTGKKDSDKSGVEWRFRGVAGGPTVFQDSTIPPPNQSVLPTAILNSSLVSGSDCAYNLDATQSKKQDGSLITSLTPAVEVDLIYNFYNAGVLLYSARIDPGDDPSINGNWVVTAGSRTTGDFTTDIVDNISGSNGLSFTLDLVTLSDILSTPGQVQIDLIIEEGALNSPLDSVVLDLCYDAPEILSLVSSNPADNTTEVSVFIPVLEATFSLDVQAVSGQTIYLRKSIDNSVAESVLVNDAAVTFTGPLLSWAIAMTLDANTDYYFDIPGGAIESTGGSSWGGTSPDTINFTTVSNVGPVASNVQLNALGAGFEVGEDVNVTFDYSDNESDLEDTGNTVIQIIRYPSEADADAFTNGTVIHTGSGNYTLTESEGNLPLKARVVPAALSGTSPGQEAFSASQLINAEPLAVITHTKQVDFDLWVNYENNESYRVNWGDGNEETFLGSTTILSHLHTYASPGTYEVKIYADADKFTQLVLTDQDLTALDVSNSTHLTNLTANLNSALTSVIMPTAQVASMTDLNLSSSDITGAFSCQNIPFSNASIQLQANSNLTSWDLTGCTGTFTLIRGDNCNLTGTFTIPSTLNLNASSTNNQMYFMSNPNLTVFDMSNLTGRLYVLQIYSCNITGDLDFGSVEFTNGNVRAESNPLLTGWDISTCTGDLNVWRFNNCALSGTQTIQLPFDSVLTNNLIWAYSNSANAWDLDVSSSSGNMNSWRIGQSQYVGTITDPGFIWTGTNAILTFNDFTTDGVTNIDLSAASGNMNFMDVGGNANLVGTLDLTGFDWVGIAYLYADGTGLTSIDHTGTSTTGAGFALYNLDNSSLSGAHALGTFTFRADSQLRIRSNSITSLDLSNVSGEVRWLYIDGNNIAGTVDVTGLNFDAVDAQILAMNQSGFTGFLFNAAATGQLSAFQAYSTAIVLQVNNMGNISMAANCNFEFFDCGLATADVDAWWNVLAPMSPGSGSGSLEGGGDNDAPSAASDTARGDLIADGYLLSI